MEDKDKKIAAAALLVVAGGIIGAGVALLLAPQSGRRTRRDIARYARDVQRKGSRAAEDLGDTVGDLVNSIEEKTEEMIDKGKTAAGGARKDLIRLIEEGAAKLEKFRTRLSRM